MSLVFQLNESLLNVSTTGGGMNPFEAKYYVTITSCRAAFQQLEFWIIILGLLFLASVTVTAFLLRHYLRHRDEGHLHTKNSQQ